MRKGQVHPPWASIADTTRLQQTVSQIVLFFEIEPPLLCCRAQRDPRGTVGMLRVKLCGITSPGELKGRDIQALGAYFCRIFFRLGDDERSPSM
jgi:hypothetical protein